MVYYDVDGQTDADGRRMFEWVSIFGAYSSTFANGTYLVGGIFSEDESYYAINSDGLDSPFPSSPDNPGSEAIKAVTSFRILETNVWSATFSVFAAASPLAPCAPDASGRTSLYRDPTRTHTLSRASTARRIL